LGNNGIQLNAPSYTYGGCSQTGGTQCNQVKTYQQFIPDPLFALQAAISSLVPATDFPDGACGVPSGNTITLPAYGSPKKCYYNASLFAANTTYLLNGVYFFDGQINIGGNDTIQNTTNGTATLIFLPATFLNPGGSLRVTGNPTIQLTAPNLSQLSSMQVPAALATSTIQKLMIDLLIYDPEAGNVKLVGDSSSYFNGTVYAPNADVTYGGNSSASAPVSGCYQVIAKGVTFSGNTNLDESKCQSDNAVQPNVFTVRLVQ
jgi:hypothetical protein